MLGNMLGIVIEDNMVDSKRACMLELIAALLGSRCIHRAGVEESGEKEPSVKV